MIFSALRDGFLNQFAGLTTGSDVVSADVEGALALRCITVLRDHKGLFGSLVDHRRLVCRIDGAQSNAVNAFYQQIIEDAGLLGRRSVCGHFELEFKIWNLLYGLFTPSSRNRPEIGRVVGQEREVERFVF
jgi:hypothetical protein